MNTAPHMRTLVEVLDALRHYGATEAYLKRLARTDSSQGQVYLGPGFQALNIIPSGPMRAEKSTHGSTFKASVGLLWLADDGSLCPAPSAQLILYPQYPEVRMSGFLRGCAVAPKDVMRDRGDGRVLILGVRPDGTVVGYAAGPGTPLACDVADLDLRHIGIFEELPLVGDSRTHLLSELRRIHELGWLDSVKLTRGGPVSYVARNGGGYTLEAHLGILPNGRGEPDFEGWEVKQHGVNSFDRVEIGVLTLMTPEPTKGYYSDAGAEAFVRKFGYADRQGRVGRTNFGGVHRVGETSPLTGLRLEFDGYDPATGLVTDVGGALNLVAQDGAVAAGWPFDHLLDLWNRKHAQAVYVPSLRRTHPSTQYSYGPSVRLGIGTDFLHLLMALASGSVYYDPGIKLEEVDGRIAMKKRSQWRVKARELPRLYEKIEDVELVCD